MELQALPSSKGSTEMWKETILENFIRPTIARAGTFLAAILLAKGVESHVVEPVVAGISAVLLYGIDLLLSRHYRQVAVQKFVETKKTVRKPRKPKASIEEGEANLAAMQKWAKDHESRARGFGPVVGTSVQEGD